jgi:MYXO-CTERM domain-containing protein
MMKKSKRVSKKESAPLSESLEKRLAGYALAAGAAGVGLLALAPPAQANIILNTTDTPFLQNESVDIVIGNRGVLGFRDRFTVGEFCSYIACEHTLIGSLKVKPLSGAAVSDFSGSGKFLPREGAGGVVNTQAKFIKSSRIMASNLFTSHTFLGIPFITKSFTVGKWANETGFLGFKFPRNGATYFGWVHMGVYAQARTGEAADIFSFAYENCPNGPIDLGQTTGGINCSSPPPAPEPGSLTLSLLALGAVGLFALRRRNLAGSN